MNERTLLEATTDRWVGHNDFAEPVIVAGEAHIAHISEQSDEEAIVIIEPGAKNTAPAIALAAALLPPEAVMLVCPSDHYIANDASFVAAARAAGELAADDWMVSLGIAPERADTGYGYIRVGARIENGAGHRVDCFIEKPDRATAERLLAAGDYVWNGGIFAFRAGAFMDELAQHRPAIVEAVRKAVMGGRYHGLEFRPAPKPFLEIVAESVDYAVMENTDRAAVVPADMGWSDIGNWEALRDVRLGDALGNRTRGDVELVDCHNVLVDTDGPRVSAIGLDNVIVVVDGNEVLVTTASESQLVGQLKGAANQ